MWHDYVFGKQTIRELSETYKLDRRTVKKHLDNYEEPEKVHNPRPVHLVVDTLYFGKRYDSWGVIVFRDYHEKENLYWCVCDTETTTVYLQGRQYLEELGYTILSVTGDGFGGIQQAFIGIPYQMCRVHMERIVIRNITMNPQTKAGVVLLALTKTLFETNEETFSRRLNQFIDKYRSFLNERTIHPHGTWSYTHKGVRSAVRSLQRFLPHLFTHETNKHIPPDTNALEGHFRHVREVTAIHCGLFQANKIRVLNSIFKASTIAPKRK